MTPGAETAHATPIWQASTPDRIEPDLADLWRRVARDGAVSRASLCNLVVVTACPRSTTDLIKFTEDIPLAATARRHPARTIVLGYSPGVHDLAGPQTAVVGVLTFGETSVRYGVELIAVHAACGEASIASIVRSLVLGGLPTAIWWVSDFSQAVSQPGASPDVSSPLTSVPAVSICRNARQFIVDSRKWRDFDAGVRGVAALLDAEPSLDVADLGWRALSPVRSAIVHAVHAESLPAAAEALEVRIDHRQPARGAASLLGGWLRSRAELPASRAKIHETDSIGQNLRVTLIHREVQIVADLFDDRVETRSNTGKPPFVMPVVIESEPDAVSAELRTVSRDATLQEALRAIVTGGAGRAG